MGVHTYCTPVWIYPSVYTIHQVDAFFLEESEQLQTKLTTTTKVHIVVVGEEWLGELPFSHPLLLSSVTYCWLASL